MALQMESENQKMTNQQKSVVEKVSEKDTAKSDEKLSSLSKKSSGVAARVFVVLNPVAGTTDAGNAKDLITSFCDEHQWECDLHETQKNEDLRHVVQDALKKGVDIVIAAGGDGTVSQVVSGMLNSNVPLGILPAGTGNNLARDLSIPLDLPGALALLGSDYYIQTMDVMEVNKKKHYVLNVSVGVTSLVMRKTKRDQKRRFGFLAYLWHAIGSIIKPDTHRFVVDVDGKKVRFSAAELMIANCKFMGFQPQMEGVSIDPDDGRLDIFIVRTKSFRGFFSVIGAFLMPRIADESPNLHYLEAHDSVQIESEFPLPAQGDGEVIGSTPVEIKLIPKSLQIIVPPPTE